MDILETARYKTFALQRGSMCKAVYKLVVYGMCIVGRVVVDGSE